MAILHRSFRHPRSGGFLAGPIVLCCLAFGLTGVGRTQTSPDDAQSRIRDVMVGMVDGVRLATTAYLPRGQGPWPAILMRTPYDKNGLKNQATGYSRRGYAVVVQDCRGRFGSEGDYIPFYTDRNDGYETVEWVAAQSWCDGEVGMFGGSALGMTAYMAATLAPPSLRCAYVFVAPSSWRRQVLRQGGIWRKELMDGWMEAQGATEIRKQWARKFILDPYFNFLEIEPDYNKINIPIYHAGGWFDIFSQGTLNNFMGLQARGRGRARGNQKLIMGATAHGRMTSGIHFSEEASDLRAADILRWFDYWLKGERNGIMDEPAAYYYLMGDLEDPDAPGNAWRTSDVWPPPTRNTAFYLQVEGKLTPTPPWEKKWATHYGYDPKNPVTTVGGANLIYDQRGPMDQRRIGDRPDYFRFHTEPLTAPIEIAGRIKAELYVSTDAPDTDFMVSLVDVYPDGYEALILDGGLRTRYREGWEPEVMMNPEEIVKIEIDLWSTAIVFNKGHRIGVHVSSSNNPRFDPNPNTGGRLRADDKTRIASNAIYHNIDHPSRIVLPVLIHDQQLSNDSGNGSR